MMPRLALFVACALAVGCRTGPQPIRYGHDTCAHCHMTATDERFGAELVTATGKVHVFDSIECLAGYLHEHPSAGEGVTRWVTDFDDPGTLVSADAVFFLHSPALRSPMGRGLAAFGAGTTPAAALTAYGGDVLDWDAVMRLAAAGVARRPSPQP